MSISMVTDSSTLVEAMAATQTNYLLKKAVTGKKEAFGRQNKIYKYLKIDIENAVPIYFNGMKYKKSLHENNLFFFLDENCKIMGILKGNSRDKITSNTTYNDLEDYDDEGKAYAIGKKVVKNRKNLTEQATHILMLTPEMITSKNRNFIKPRFIERKDAIRDLEARLDKYKKEKYDNVPHEVVLQNAKDSIKYFADKIMEFETEAEEMKFCKNFKDPIWHASDVRALIRGTSDIVGDYVRNYREVQRYKKKNIDMEFCFGKEGLRKNKVNLIKIHKTIQDL